MNPAIEEIQNRIKNKRNSKIKINGTSINKKNNKTSSYISNLFTRTLISIILILACAIFVNLNDENLLFFKNKLFKDTIAFAKINELYTKYFGNIVPEMETKTTPVFNDTSVFSTIEPVGNSYTAQMNTNTLSFLESGIVVFAGDKEDYGKTVIIQGVDGVDIWYSNLQDINVTMYDYVEKDNILGEVNDGKAILTFVENGEFIGYEKYISQS